MEIASKVRGVLRASEIATRSFMLDDYDGLVSLIPEYVKKKHESINDFSRKIGLSYETCHSLAVGKRLPTHRHMLLLCRLWRCQPGDLVKYRP